MPWKTAIEPRCCTHEYADRAPTDKDLVRRFLRIYGWPMETMFVQANNDRWAHTYFLPVRRQDDEQKQ